MPSIPELPMEAIIAALIALARLYPETFRVLLLTGDAPLPGTPPKGRPEPSAGRDLAGRGKQPQQGLRDPVTQTPRRGA
jgi:hypothetical protein